MVRYEFFYDCIMRAKVSFLPIFKPVHVKGVLKEDKVSTLLTEATEIIESAVSNMSSIVEEQSYDFGIVIGHEDFFESARDHIGDGCIPQAQGLAYFVNELCKLSARYPNVLLIPGTIYLSVNKLIQDEKHYRQNGSKNYTAAVYVQNIAPVFYRGQLIRLIKKGNYLEGIFRDEVKASKLRRESITTENDFLEMLSSTCERLEVSAYAEDELESFVPRVVMFGKTPLPGEEQLLQKYNLAHENFFSPVFTVKGVHCGLEICADHRRAQAGLLPCLRNLDIHLLTCFGQTPVYDGTNNQGFFIRADHDSSTIYDMKVDKAIEIEEPLAFSNKTGRLGKDQAFTLFTSAMNSTEEPLSLSAESAIISLNDT
ncbi:hypothetical protein SAMN02746073_0556 [Legionella jamestowniensis DSM 19215]|uniref:Pyoverdine/dityrosine biosynthesis protein n=2 Tax=Legionella jamestowniensis TaxID=455 RepID=A0A0W0UKT2_9GAMM|nr:hypothetical protein Ljam_2616 [Legionella jamestowniensis]SFL50802.1 hypothetical protein SAMN02746073_0556 [Legionella jamestowniensis DSM 19215]